ncbi:MAG: nucleotidyltransferase family protein [Bacteriovorax sp.]|jgi:glucose-1-phosphate cytidylyltransferase
MKHNATALILCGGRGERLRPLTESTPKPLVHLKGRPILSYLLDHIKKFNITNVVIAAGFQAEKIHQFFENNHKDLNVTIINSGDVDIINRIKDCSTHIESDFILFYGDTLADVNLDKLQEFHYSHDSKATITLWPLKSQFGLAEIDPEDNVTSFKEKPTLDQWINIGNFYYEHEVLNWLKDFKSYAEFLEYMGKEKKLKGFKHNGVHITVNTIRELEEAEQNIHEFE